MLIPLKQFYCDTCGQIIESPNEGYTEWKREVNLDTNEMTAFCSGFKIIHNKPYSPNPDKGCSQYLHDEIIEGSMSKSLERMLSLGLISLLSFLDDGKSKQRQYNDPEISAREMRDFVAFFSRLIIPYYEEARKYFLKAETELFYRELGGEEIYDPSILEKIVQKFSIR